MGARDVIHRPQASAELVEDLVGRVVRGEVRIPAFQRGLKWKTKDVIDLFDSIYRGFPIGALLLRQGPAEAAKLQVGPLQVFGEESSHAWWVIDGQQRLTALTAGLARPLPLPVATPDDRYLVYFDASMRTFHSPTKGAEPPSRWVPLPVLLDSSQLGEWLLGWKHCSESAMRSAVFEAGKRIREYRVPIYVIDTDDEEVLRQIFFRVNGTGQPLEWSEVHDALYGHRGTEPSSLAQLADRLEQLGVGRPDENSQLLPCLLAFQGEDVTRSPGEYFRDAPDHLEGVVAASLPVLREVLGFLRVRAEIPHLRLLPYSTPLVVLTRFFRLHPVPNERSLRLLVRWVWRTLLTPDHDDRALKRQGVKLISASDEESSVQALLAVAPRQPSREFEVRDQFDARSAHSRIVLLALASLHPLDAPDGARVDIAAEVRARDAEAFRALFPLQGGISKSPANRLLLPGNGSAAAGLRSDIEQIGVDHPFLRSHAITSDVAQAILERDINRAIHLRGLQIVRAVAILEKRLAEWGRTDRPSIQYVLELGAEP